MKGALLVLPGVSIAKESNSAARDRSFEALHIAKTFTDLLSLVCCNILSKNQTYLST